jgi:hypothetical protein
MPDEKIHNSESAPNTGQRRSGGSPNDPDGGHELFGAEWHGPDPDPIDELVPGGQGAEAPPVRAGTVPKNARPASQQPGFGPTEFDKPKFEGYEDPSEGTPSESD